MQIKTTMKCYHLEWPLSKELNIISAGENVERNLCTLKKEPLYTVDRNVDYYNHYGKSMKASKKKSKLTLP